MKMETTVPANENGKIKKVYLKAGVLVHQDDLVVEMD